MTYDYVCSNCQHEWEVEQRISEDPIKTCPTCAQETARRQISGGAGFILKGGGWYADGYGSSKSAAKPEESKASSDSDKGSPAKESSTKSDAKGDSKADSSGSGNKSESDSKPSSAKSASAAA